jgi:hypothetical protein
MDGLLGPWPPKEPTRVRAGNERAGNRTGRPADAGAGAGRAGTDGANDHRRGGSLVRSRTSHAVDGFHSPGRRGDRGDRWG